MSSKDENENKKKLNENENENENEDENEDDDDIIKIIHSNEYDKETINQNKKNNKIKK